MPLFSDMSFKDMQDYLARDDRVLLPIGATEEHGPHLGLGTDYLEAEAIAVGAGQISGVAVAPTLAYGESCAMMGFSGTLTLRPATLTAVLEDLFRASYHHGFRRILVVNGHGGNIASLSNAVQTVAQDLPGLRLKVFSWWLDAEVNRVVVEMMGEQQGSHASAAETAFMLAVRPAGVKLERLSGRDAPVKPSRDVPTVQTFAGLYPDGIMGLNPHRATREAGEALLKKSIEICVREAMQW
ncbi:MAG TPA: creatininase family protein [bacterium]|jgi:creatinine amidohydrolase